MLTFGIDPGITGAIAVFKNEELLKVIDIPTMPFGGNGKKNMVCAPVLYEALLKEKEEHYIDSMEGVIERVASMPGMGAPSIFNFGMSYGMVIGVLGSLKIPVHYVTPIQWKKHHKLVGADKEASRAKVIEQFPDKAHLFYQKKHHNRADAVLISLFHIHVR